MHNQDHAEKLKERIIKSVNDLPPMPEVVTKSREIMADPGSDLDDLAAVIETDQSMVARILKLVNSPYYGLGREVSSIRQACALLGFRKIEEVIISAGVSNVLGRKLPGYEFESGELWLHSMAAAFCSRLLAEKRDAGLVSDAYTGGLLHDVGKIILDDYVLEKKAAFDAFMMDETKTVNDAEKAVLGFDHGEIASEVCERWHIPARVIPAIHYHHYPSRSGGEKLAYIVHTADHLVRLSGLGYEDDDLMCELEPGTTEFLGFTQEILGNVTFEVLEYIQNVQSEFS